jgi:hypothetical protein
MDRTISLGQRWWPNHLAVVVIKVALWRHALEGVQHVAAGWWLVHAA